jgi:hypothetical protein
VTSSSRGGSASSLEQWLVARAAAAPASLRPRLTDALRGVSEGETAVERSCRAGEALLAKLLAEDCSSRSAAPDLLTADALVTYAFEAAAEDAAESASSLDSQAAAAMARIAAAAGDAR